MKWLPPVVFINRAPKPRPVHKPTYAHQSREELIKTLGNLNKMDNDEILTRKRNVLKDAFPADKEVIDSITDSDLLDDLDFLLTFFPKDRKLNIENKVRLRMKVEHLIKTYKSMSDDVYSILVEFLKHHKAL